MYGNSRGHRYARLHRGRGLRIHEQNFRAAVLKSTGRDDVQFGSNVVTTTFFKEVFDCHSEHSRQSIVLVRAGAEGQVSQSALALPNSPLCQGCRI
jgi:hypothetical protein